MQIIEKPYFKCDFCGKRQFRKGDMTLHERWCKKNPANMHKCFQYCKHLVKDKEDYDVELSFDEGYSSKRTIFICGLTGQKMYSSIAERRKLPVVNEPDTIRMPLECDKYKDQMDSIFD